MPDSLYFAAAPTSEIATRLHERTEKHLHSTTHQRLLTLLEECYQNYHAVDITPLGPATTIGRGGGQGELLEIRTNHARALVGVLLNLVTAQRLSWAPKAVSSDYEAMKEVTLAASVLEWLWQVKGVSTCMAKAVEAAIWSSEGFVLLDWDTEAGEDISPHPVVPGKVIRSGDLVFRNVHTWNVIRDPSKPSWDALDSVTIRLPWNKFDLAARFPAKAAKALDCGYEDTTLPEIAPSRGESDDVVVYRFLHKSCAILPWGRDVGYLSNGTLLWDRVLKGGVWPLFRITPSERVGTPYGYTPFFDVLGLQEIFDGINSSIATNQTTFATQNIAVQEGTSVQVDHLDGGLNLVYYPAGAEPPKPLQLTASPPEAFGYLKDTKGSMELLFGLNAIVRGEAVSDKLSGTAMALLQSQALSQSGMLQGAYIRAVEEAGIAALRMFRECATEPRKVALVGKARSHAISTATISSESFGRIDRVTVEVGNPLSNNPAGRLEVASQLLQMNLLRTPEEYLQVLQTGRLDPAVQGLQDVLMLIASENEMMSEAQVPLVMVTDDALLHCREHLSVISNPEARANPDVVKAYIEHVNAHYLNYFGVPPEQDPFYRQNMMLLAGVQPPPMPMAPPPGGDPSASPAALGAPPEGPKTPSLPNLPGLPPGAADPSQGPPAV